MLETIVLAPASVIQQGMDQIARTPVAAERSHLMTLSPFEKLDLVRLPDGRVGAIVGVWNLGEAYEVDVGDVRETWSADDLTPTA